MIGILLAFLLYSQSLAGRNIILDDACYIILPDSLKEVKYEGMIYAAYGQDYFIGIKSGYVEDFDKIKVMNMMDTLCFNMRDYDFVEEQHESFWSIAEDYSYKFYRSKTDSMMSVTYTWYSPQQPYCILCNYTNHHGIDMLQQIVRGIRTPVPEGLRNQFFICKQRGAGTLYVLLLIALGVGFVLGLIMGGDLGLAFISTIIGTLIMLLPALFVLWGFWYMLIIMFLPCAIAVIAGYGCANELIKFFK